MNILTIRGEKIQFEAFHLASSSNIFIVFLTGLHEPTSGLYYTFKEMGLYLKKTLDVNLLYFDLAGTSNSLYELDFSLWEMQLQAIKDHFQDKKLVFITRGASCLLIKKEDKAIAIGPCRKDIYEKLIHKMDWEISPFNPLLLTPKLPLNADGIAFFHNLGAESECIGGFEISPLFLKDLQKHLQEGLPENTYEIPSQHHPLFNQLSDRHKLNEKICEILKGIILKENKISV